tara:strand:+ start:163 stop:357 length:195 start_codon:yes stop_codon:yes gene_type:complete
VAIQLLLLRLLPPGRVDNVVFDDNDNNVKLSTKPTPKTPTPAVDVDVVIILVVAESLINTRSTA